MKNLENYRKLSEYNTFSNYFRLISLKSKTDLYVQKPKISRWKHFFSFLLGNMLNNPMWGQGVLYYASGNEMFRKYAK